MLGESHQTDPRHSSGGNGCTRSRTSHRYSNERTATGLTGCTFAPRRPVLQDASVASRTTQDRLLAGSLGAILYHRTTRIRSAFPESAFVRKSAGDRQPYSCRRVADPRMDGAENRKDFCGLSRRDHRHGERLVGSDRKLRWRSRKHVGSVRIATGISRIQDGVCWSRLPNESQDADRVDDSVHDGTVRLSLRRMGESQRHGNVLTKEGT